MDLTDIYFRKKRKQLERLTDHTVLYFALFISISITIIVFLFAAYKGKILDPEMPITPIPESQVISMSDMTVDTGILVHDFSEFNMLKNHFIAQATVWFYFNPATVDKSIIDKFSFEKGVILSKTEPREIKYGDKLLVLYEIELQCQGFFDYSHFPLDQHRLDFILINPAADPNKLLYVTSPDSIELAKGAFTEGWRNIGKSTKYGYIQDTFDPPKEKLPVSYERTIFSFAFEHSSLKEGIIIFMPLILMFMIGLLSLLLDMVFESREIIELAVGSTLALVFFSNYIRTFTPVTGTFSLVDAFYVLLMAFMSGIFLIQIFALQHYRKKQKTTQLTEVLEYTLSYLTIFRSVFFLIILLAFNFLFFYILILR
ncbi:MAG: hypothetical protein K1X28_07220 [Parachlamydiales bacterium]|nr:hypothetical protein [Parachlamydiales bacterium]